VTSENKKQLHLSSIHDLGGHQHKICSLNATQKKPLSLHLHWKLAWFTPLQMQPSLCTNISKVRKKRSD